MSGDLKRMALDAKGPMPRDPSFADPLLMFKDACTPDAILGLYEEIDRLRAHLAKFGPVAFAAGNCDERMSQDHINALVSVTTTVLRDQALCDAIEDAALSATAREPRP